MKVYEKKRLKIRKLTHLIQFFFFFGWGKGPLFKMGMFSYQKTVCSLSALRTTLRL